MNSYSESRELLGSKISLQLRGEASEEQLRALAMKAFAEVERIEETYSRFLEESELSHLNTQLGQWVEISDEFYGLIHFGESVRTQTRGAFDLTVQSILEGWGYDSMYSLTEKAAGETGKIELRASSGDDAAAVKISQPIDLGGLGKGYAIDRIRALLEDQKNGGELEHYLIDAGGDLYAKGEAADGPWAMIFEHPLDAKKAIGEVEVDGFALACSSPLRRRWRNKHHLVEPRSKTPAGELLAV